MNFIRSNSMQKFLCAGVAVLFICSLGSSLTVTQTATGISLDVESTGAYTITTTSPAWTFGGNLSKTLTNIAEVDSTDTLGRYTGITFNLTGTGPLQGTIRLYQSIPVVMFSMKTLAQMASLGLSFPNLTTYPTTNMLYMGQQHIVFATPTFTLSSIGADAALISFNAQSQTFVFSAADHFWEVSNSYTSTSLSSSIQSWATPLPAGWNHQCILAVGNGINNTCNIWGQGLRGYYGKPLPSNQNSLPLSSLGYWTDHYAYYYYTISPQFANYEAEMVAVKLHYDTLKIPIKYLDLDSWWYKKGCDQGWNEVSNGIYLWQVVPAVFPDGFYGAYKKIGVPFLAHHRWYQAPCSPIDSTYGLSGGLPLQYAAWKSIITPNADSGVMSFEQDWLNENALVAEHIGDLDSAMGNTAKVCSQLNLTQMYCMELPMYFQQAAKYPTLTTIRSTNDGYEQNYWTDHIFTSRFAWSMGLFPWTDNFKSTNSLTGCIISCVLSGGIFGPSDEIGAEVTANILPATRRDGTLIKCDVPALPTEATYIAFAQSKAANPVTFTYTDHGNNFKTYYVWAPGAAATSYSFSPAAEGFPAPANGMYAYDWFAKTGQFVAAGNSLTSTCAAGTNSFQYWVVAPVGASGIAFLGDLSKYISCGRQRITSLVDAATQVTATVDLEPQEDSVILSGYATTKPAAVCSNNATLGAVSFASDIFSVVLKPVAGAGMPMAVAFGSNPVAVGRAAAQPVRNSNISVIASRGRLSIDIGTNSNFSVTVYTLNGRRCFVADYLNRRSVVISSLKLQSAAYMVEIRQITGSYVKKITMQ
jgi:hypothetical protein